MSSLAGIVQSKSIFREEKVRRSSYCGGDFEVDARVEEDHEEGGEEDGEEEEEEEEPQVHHFHKKTALAGRPPQVPPHRWQHPQDRPRHPATTHVHQDTHPPTHAVLVEDWVQNCLQKSLSGMTLY